MCCHLFKASALWADAFYKSKCPSVRLSVCPSVRLSVCPSVCLFSFEVPFNGLFAPTSQSGMSNIFRDSESMGKSNGKKWSNIWTFLFRSGLKSPRKKSFFCVADFALVHPPMASVLLSALVERCFVSRMREIYFYFEKDVWNLDIFDWEPTKMFVFLHFFSHLLFHLELLSTHMTSITLYMCVFMCKIRLKHFHVNCVGNISRKKREHTKHMQKKKHRLIFNPSLRYPDSKHFFSKSKSSSERRGLQ